MMRSAADTIAAIATAPGPGGIGIVRLSGPEALGLAEAVVRFHETLERPRPRFAHRVDVVDGDPPHAAIDDGLLLYMPGPHSYTGEDVIELQGHGGVLVTTRVLDAVLRAGARPADPGEFTLRAFLNGRLDLAQAEAVADLVAAPTAEALAAAADQLAGRLSSSVGDLRRACVDLMARLEAEIDFAEEDVPPVPRDDVGRTLATIDRDAGGDLGERRSRPAAAARVSRGARRQPQRGQVVTDERLARHRTRHRHRGSGHHPRRG